MVAGGSIRAGRGGDGPRDGALFASSSVPAFKTGETVTFDVPWLSEHHELTLTFPLNGLAEVNRAVRAASREPALLRCLLAGGGGSDSARG